MPELSIITRGRSTAQGKPRVYVSCHPDDFGKYFSIICDDIMQTQNCALYYYQPEAVAGNAQPDTDALGEMQLFVFILTSKYLNEDNRSYRFEYGFAMEHHIPILPIAVESDIAGDFAVRMNRIKQGYGAVQFLDRTIEDGTAIPYAEKLANRLNNILVGDEMAERIRKAFDAYIFLSYRKVDRAYAKELMQLIHSIPFCRDVAIWYDEFLVPGDDDGWYEGILEAMKKSSLVTIAVTPRLVEGDNFIVTHEYPDARAMNKLIIPAEVDKTDRRLLGEKFPDFPPCVNGTNLAAMTVALGDIALNRGGAPGNDPEHCYLVGLAYLGGIDVEKDTARALELLRQAAEAGHHEALRKLARMYGMGDGVPYDMLTGIEWQEKLVATLEKEDDRLENNTLVRELWELGVAWEALGKMQEAKQVYERMSGYAKERLQYAPSDETRKDYLDSGEKLGDICSVTGNRAEARKYYLEILKERRQLLDKEYSLENCVALFAVLDRLGVSYIEEGKIQMARDCYESILPVAEKYANETGNVRVRHFLGISHSRLSDICRFENKYSEAKEHCSQAIRMAEELVAESSTQEFCRFLAMDYERMGSLCMNEGNRSEARKWFEKNLEIAEKLAASSNNMMAKARRELGLSYGKLGDVCASEGKWEEAGKYYEQNLSIFEQLTAESDAIDNIQNLAVSYKRLGDLMFDQGDEREAAKYYDKCLQLEPTATRGGMTMPMMKMFYNVCQKAGDIYRVNRDIVSAKRYYCRMLEMATAAYKKTKLAADLHKIFGSYCCLGKIYCAEGNRKLAEEYYKECINITSSLAAESQILAYKENLSFSYRQMGDFYEEEGRLEDAEKYYRKALPIIQKLNDEVDYAEVKRSLIASYLGMGGILCKEKVLHEARRYFEQALEIANRLVKETKMQIDERMIYGCYEGLGEVCEKEGNLAQARDYLLRCLDYSAFLMKKDASIGNRRSYAAVCASMGEISLAENKTSEANVWYKQALDLNLQLIKESRNFQSRHDLATAYKNYGTVNKDPAMLRQALALCDELVRECPRIKKYRDLRDEIREKLTK